VKTASATDTLEREIEKYLDPARRPSPFLFLPAALEELYDQDRLSAPDQRPKILIFATVLIGLFAAGDYAISPESIGRSLFFRIVVPAPCTLLLLWLVGRPRLRPHRDLLYLLFGLVAGACCVAAFPGYDTATSLFTQVSLVLILWAVMEFTRVKMHLALLCLTFFCLLNLLLLAHSPWLTRVQKLTSIAQFSAAAVLSAISRHRSEWMQRLSYLLRLREQLRASELANLNITLSELSMRDPLTGVANRRHFDQQLQTLWQRALHSVSPVAVAMIDIDDFKRLNDTYGHPAGDRVLMLLAETLRANIRSGTDLVARFGGEEFAVLGPGLSQQEAFQAAERLRLSVANTTFTGPGIEQALHCSVSCGVASLRPRHSHRPADLIITADAALYRAKREGRNRVCV
jgi:diguanylate cyclase (GGDEF)-like protein